MFVMRRYLLSLFFTLPIALWSETPLTTQQARKIVQLQETAIKQARAVREHRLESASIVETAVAYHLDRKIIFNRVLASQEAVPPEQAKEATDVVDVTELLDFTDKPTVSAVMAVTIWDEAISEISWLHQKQRYRIFTNANFAYFLGMGLVEDDETRYSVFLSPSHKHTEDEALSEGEWRPAFENFTPGQIEYFIVEWGDSAEPDEAAFDALTALLQHYVEYEKTMKVKYDNMKLLMEETEAYREANPPEKRDAIINFRPTGKSAENSANQ